MLEIIEHEEQALVQQVLSQALLKRLRAALAHSQRLGHRRQHECGGRQRRELDEEDAIAELP